MKTISIIIIAYFYFYKGLLFFLFSKKENKLSCSIDTLINNFSFRAPLKLNFFLFDGKMIKDSFKKIWMKAPVNPLLFLDANSKNAIFDGSFKHKELIKDDYLGELFQLKFNMIAIYENIYFTGNILARLVLTLIYIIGLIPLHIALPFCKNRKSTVYAYYELIEIIAVTDIVKKRKVNSVYTFLSYEKSSNFLAFLLDRYTISLTKVCSPNPIKIHYKKVVANRFVFTAPYQQEEYEELKKNWYVDKTELWPVYDFKKYRQQYKGKHLVDGNNRVIGFYSSAFFRRNELGNNNVNNNYRKSEVKLLELLNLFLINHPEYSLKMYLHPLEKSDDDVYRRIIGYYNEFFAETSDRLHFHPRDEETWLDFQNINVAISVTSTVSFERLYCGFKSLYAPLYFEKGFFDGTKLEAISIKDSELFDSFLLNNLEISEEDFFVKNNIGEYVYY